MNGPNTLQFLEVLVAAVLLLLEHSFGVLDFFSLAQISLVDIIDLYSERLDFGRLLVYIFVQNGDIVEETQLICFGS